jgi:hypothetical protein
LWRQRDSPRKPRKAPKLKEYRYFTDEEAQAFFAGVERDADGNILCVSEEE